MISETQPKCDANVTYTISTGVRNGRDLEPGEFYLPPMTGDNVDAASVRVACEDCSLRITENVDPKYLGRDLTQTIRELDVLANNTLAGRCFRREALIANMDESERQSTINLLVGIRQVLTPQTPSSE